MEFSLNCNGVVITLRERKAANFIEIQCTMGFVSSAS